MNDNDLPAFVAGIGVEIVGDCAFEGGEKPKVGKSLVRIDEALKMPNAFRIGGKTVITSYPMIRLGDKSMAFYRALKAELVRRYGDRVALMPYFTPFPLEYGKPYDRPAWQKIRVVYDRKTVRIDVDGQKGTPVALSGDFFYARHSALGALGRGDTFFNGRMKSLVVTPTVR